LASKASTNFFFGLLFIFGILCLISAGNHLTESTSNVFDDLVWSLYRFIGDQVLVVVVEVPFTGGFGIVCTAGGTLGLTKS